MLYICIPVVLANPIKEQRGPLGCILAASRHCSSSPIKGRPRENPTLPVSLSSSPNSKPPIPHLNARYLMLHLYHWHLLKIWHSGGFCGARCVFCTHCWQGKGAFLKLPWLTSASGYKHCKWYIALLQCQIWGRGTGNASEWKALTQGTKGKKRKFCRSISALNFLVVFPLRVVGKLWLRQNLNGVNWWPDWFLTYVSHLTLVRLF